MGRENWLLQLRRYAEETESPRLFWLWCGISAIAAALQRRVWLPFGDSRLFPNLYVLIVAVPGKCRKGKPVSFAKKVLRAAGVEVFADSPTKRALTMKMDELGKTQWFRWTNEKGEKKLEVHSSIALVSKELSSLLAIEPKAMIECLTDLYDAHDIWDYETSGKGKDKITGVCVNLLMASTPRWIANNLPEEAIGGGFTRRIIIVYSNEQYKEVSLPPPPPPALWDKLVEDLGRIAALRGPFKFSEEARKIYDVWYASLGELAERIYDERIQNNVWSCHVHALKTAMCLRVAESDELVITPDNMQKAIKLVEGYLQTASHALAGQGSGSLSALIYRILQQVKQFKKTTLGEILRLNWSYATKSEVDQVLDTLVGMGNIKMVHNAQTGKSEIHWVGGGKGNL